MWSTVLSAVAGASKKWEMKLPLLEGLVVKVSSWHIYMKKK